MGMNGEHLKTARLAARMSQMDLTVALDLESQSMISMVERGERSLSLDNAVKASQVLGVSVDYLVGLSDDPRTYSNLIAVLGQMDAVRYELGGGDSSELGLMGDARYVEIHEVEAAAGVGLVVEGAPVVGRLAFQRDWLVAHRINPDLCTVITVSGDSMEPRLPDGCSILVDHSRRVLRHGHIYVLELGEELLVKRAEGSARSGWMMVSENRYWPPTPWPEGAVVKGEVRWSAQTF